LILSPPRKNNKAGWNKVFLKRKIILSATKKYVKITHNNNYLSVFRNKQIGLSMCI
jgi:hypothetical protein